MADLAYSTGGIYVHNNDNLDEGLRKISDRPQYVYLLGFSPDRLDDKFHKLKVSVKGTSKLIVQARTGYYALKPVASQQGTTKPGQKAPNSGPVVVF